MLLTIIAGIAVLVLGMLEMVRNKVLGPYWPMAGSAAGARTHRASLRAAVYGGPPRSRSVILRRCERFLEVLGATLCSTRRGHRYLAVIWLMHPVLANDRRRLGDRVVRARSSTNSSPAHPQALGYSFDRQYPAR